MELTTPAEYIRYSPLFALINGKDEASKKSLLQRFEKLPENAKDILAAEETGSSLKNLEANGVLPSSHVVAVAKIVAFIALGDVTIADTPQLLAKIGLSETQTQTINIEIKRILQPLTTSRGAAAPVPQRIQELPPMTRPTETGPKPITSSGTPQRNIIDLRNKS